MNKYFFNLFIICMISLNSFCQQSSNTGNTSNSSSNIDTNKINKIDSNLQLILSKLKDSEVENKQFVGVIKLDTTKRIKVIDLSKSSSNLDSVTVQRVTLLIKDGYIVDINVYTSSDTYINTKAPITISSRRFSEGDFLYGINNNKAKIVLKDFLSFEPTYPFVPNDDFITLTKLKFSDSLFREVGVNTVFDLRLYTDALGLLGEEPNGLTQMDFRLKQILHRLNKPNTGAFFFHFLKINFNAARFDSKLKYVDSVNFSMSEFSQKSWLNAEAALNIFSIWIEKKSLSSFYIDIGMGINSSNLARNTDTIRIIGQNIFAEFGLNLLSSNNMGIDLYARINQKFSPQTIFYKYNSATLLRFGTEAFWNPLKDRNGRIFGRINYIISPNKEEREHHYFQVQLGYSILLTKALGNIKN